MVDTTKGRKWTIASALAYINTVKSGRNPKGLKYWSAKDFLSKHKVATPNTVANVEEQ